MDERYLGENLPNNLVWGRSQVQYLSRQERAAFEIKARNGKLYAADGSLFDTVDASSVFRDGAGRAIFVMDGAGVFYASKYQRVGEFHHSSLLAGGSVAAAREMEVRNGILIFLSDRSGHYRPSRELTD